MSTCMPYYTTLNKLLKAMHIVASISLAKKQVLESIDSLNDEQVHAVSSFIKYLTEYKPD